MTASSSHSHEHNHSLLNKVQCQRCDWRVVRDGHWLHLLPVAFGYVFTEPALRPPTKWRWKMRNKMTTGRQPRTLIAIIWFHW
jgi:hypothetical protein